MWGGTSGLRFGNSAFGSLWLPKEGEREGGREGGRERGREGEREISESLLVYTAHSLEVSVL